MTVKGFLARLAGFGTCNRCRRVTLRSILNDNGGLCTYCHYSFCKGYMKRIMEEKAEED